VVGTGSARREPHPFRVRRTPRIARRPRSRRAPPGARRRPGESPAHGGVRLPLLPSGPDGVCRLPLRRAWPPAGTR